MSECVQLPAGHIVIDNTPPVHTCMTQHSTLRAANSYNYYMYNIDVARYVPVCLYPIPCTHIPPLTEYITAS